MNCGGAAARGAWGRTGGGIGGGAGRVCQLASPGASSSSPPSITVGASSSMSSRSTTVRRSSASGKELSSAGYEVLTWGKLKSSGRESDGGAIGGATIRRASPKNPPPSLRIFVIAWGEYVSANSRPQEHCSSLPGGGYGFSKRCGRLQFGQVIFSAIGPAAPGAGNNREWSCRFEAVWAGIA